MNLNPASVDLTSRMAARSRLVSRMGDWASMASKSPREIRLLPVDQPAHRIPFLVVTWRQVVGGPRSTGFDHDAFLVSEKEPAIEAYSSARDRPSSTRCQWSRYSPSATFP